MHFWHYITKEEAKRGLWRHNGLFGIFVSGISAQLLLDWHLFQTLKLGHVGVAISPDELLETRILDEF